MLSVLRLASVFEPEAAEFDDDAARFDPIGGMQNHTAALSRCLDQLGIEQTIVTSRLAARRGRQRLGRHGVVHRVGLHISHLRQLWALCAVPVLLGSRPRRFDVVHAHQGEDIAVLALAMVARGLSRCPLVVTVHTSVQHTLQGTGPRTWALRRLGGALERVALRRADAVLVLVERTAAALREDGVRPERIHVLPSGFEPALFAAQHADPFDGVPVPRVGYVGRLAEQKAPQVVVEAFASVSAPASLVIVGDGPLRSVVEQAIERSPARDRIRSVGFVPHLCIPAVLQSLDVLVLPSRYEEMGSVLVEAMASGLPVVASAVGGIPEIVLDGETGLLVPPGDTAALAQAVDELVGDEERRRRMSRSARQRSESYAWPALAARVAALYTSLAGADRPFGVT